MTPAVCVGSRVSACVCFVVCVGQVHTATSSFIVRGDGVSTLVATDASAPALSVSATASAFTNTAVAVSASRAATSGFWLLTVCESVGLVLAA